ncbi:MAG: 16S rRNA (guanine(527)-N(7))-methyltransferase RsmG [Deltaproteobacteria bacterium]|nr:16S rRNA (guanine(527)-N(7))-methyltransferase RsmG [Deltaproteobacteria bacterium]
MNTANLPPDPLSLLQDGAAALGLELSPHTLEQFGQYLAQLQHWNTRVNLTAISTDRDIVTKHFLDSLAVLPFLGEPASLADLGSGAGFPGLALKLVLPDMALTLVEARQKKAVFLEFMVSHLRLTGVEVANVHLTHTLARQWGPRFAAMVTRAAFCLEIFLPLAAPLLLPGGVALALKGPHLPPGELAGAEKLVPLLGLGPLEIISYNLPITREPRLAVRTCRKAA